MNKAIEDLKFNSSGLIPAIVADADTGDVLMMAWMNAGSIQKTIETGKTHFWSRSRKKFWMKGETSGNVQQVKGIYADCDRDTLLLKVEQTGGACHTGHRSCFSWHLEGNSWVEKGKKLFDPDEVYKDKS